MERWKDEDLALLKKRYPNRDFSVEVIAKLLHRTVLSVRCKATELNITRGIKRWKIEYDTFLEENYKTLGALECATILDYTESHIQRRVRQLGLNKKIKFWSEEEVETLRELSNKHFTQAEIAEVLDKTITQIKNKLSVLRIKSSWWSESEVSFLKANYNSHNACEIVKCLNRSKATVYRKASLLRLTKKDNSGRNHYAFIEDPRKYPVVWSPKLRRRIRERDGYKCQVCMKTQNEEERDLQVHHIDYNKENCEESNLISLCMACHIKTNINRKQWQLFFESLFKELVLKF